MNEKLIFDVGAHIGEDTTYYLSLGYNVVAVDADPFLTKENSEKFAGDVTNQSVQFLNYAVADNDGGVLTLFMNEDSIRNSVIREFGTRYGKATKEVEVPTITLATLMQQYGVPFYCKIDIEGMDAVAVRSMGTDTASKPKYISVEAECKTPEELQNEDGIFDTLDALKAAGYTKFKIVDQTTLRVLDRQLFYSKRDSFFYKLKRKSEKLLKNYTDFHASKELLRKQHGYNFPDDSTGPFGEKLAGGWMTFEEAHESYLMHRRDFYTVPGNLGYVFWVDWHATF